jgi:hypothetical protein
MVIGIELGTHEEASYVERRAKKLGHHTHPFGYEAVPSVTRLSAAEIAR